MKKILYLLMFTFISVFLINIDKVYAYECVYGKKYDVKDSTGKVIKEDWSQQLTINVNGYDDYNPVVGKSPILSGYINNNYGTFTKKNESGVDYWESRDGIGFYVKLYLSIYPSNDIYNDSNNKCPSVLKFRHSTILKNNNVYALYNDELDSDEYNKKKNFFQKIYDGTVKEDGYYILESEKDKSLNDLIDKYNCLTYTSSIKKLKEAKNKYGTCDNNSDFTYEYDKLYSLCESFRATASYVTDDSGEISAKTCMTACSNLKDDVAEICNRKYSDVKCGSLGQKIIKWIYKIIRMVRYVIPILLIILSILDYIKAIGNDSDDEMKKATGKFFKRLIVAAIIFIIPFILEFILKMFHLPGLDSKNPFCAN